MLFIAFIKWGGIKKSIKSSSNPAVPLAEHQRDQVYLKNIQKMAAKLRELEDKLNRINL